MKHEQHNTPPYTVDISKQEVKPDDLSQEDIATMNQLVSIHGPKNDEEEVTLKLKYYEVVVGSQDLNNGLVKISKKIADKNLQSDRKKISDNFIAIDCHADKVQLFPINNDIFTIPTIPDSGTMFAAVVILPNEETKSMCIESTILPRGKKAIDIIKKIQGRSVYWLECKTSGACRKNAIDCPVHCASHKLKLNEKNTNSHVVVFLYKKNDWGTFLPPGDPPDELLTSSIVLKFDDKIYRSVPCDGDGACLFYSVSNFILNNKERFNDVPIFNNQKTFKSSNILDRIWKFIGTITSDDMEKIIEMYPMDDIEKGAKQKWTKKIPKMNEKHSVWVTKFMTEITNSWHTTTDRYPMELHALFLSWIFKIRIQIIHDNFETGYFCQFDSNSVEKNFCPDVQNIDRAFTATCLLLHCHGAIPLYTCHWISRYIHYEYLEPIQNPTAELEKNAYTGCGGTSNPVLNPYRIYNNIYDTDRQVASERTSTAQNAMVSSSSEGMSYDQNTSETSIPSTNKVALIGVGGKKTKTRARKNTPDNTITTSSLTPTHAAPTSIGMNQIEQEQMNQVVQTLKDGDVQSALAIFNLYQSNNDDSMKKSRVDYISIHCHRNRIDDDIVKSFLYAQLHGDDSSEIEQEATTSTAKKRGRPPGKKVNQEEGAQNKDVSTTTKTENEVKVTTPTTKKRGRGRPRKDDVDTTIISPKKPKLFTESDSSSDSSCNSGDEENEQVNETNNSSSIHNKHCRHSKDTIVQDQTSLSAMNHEAIVNNLPNNLKNIMKKALKLKKIKKEKKS